jgi:predicted alpha/beta superfamily hydrolase
MKLKTKKSILLVSVILIAGAYFLYQKISNQIAEKKHRQWVESLESTASQNVQILADTIEIDYLDEKRTLAIYLPANYGKDTQRYSVIYFLDGQSLFDQKIQEGTEWQIDEVLDSLGMLNQAQSIIVGMNSSEDRLKEYKPFPSTRWYSDKIVSGDQHAKWIVEHVVPWIDARYRTKKDPKSTIIAGASLGGLMSYYMLMEYPTVFGGAIVFSPSFWVNEIVFTLHEKNPQVFDQKIYFDAGQLETPTVKSIEKMKEILVNYGVPEGNIKLDIEEGEGHWHMTWKKGFKKAYPWIIE